MAATKCWKCAFGTGPPFEPNERYSIILSRSALHKLGFIIDYKTQKFTWDEGHVPMNSIGHWTQENFRRFRNVLRANRLNKLKIEPAKYIKADLEDIAVGQEHL